MSDLFYALGVWYCVSILLACVWVTACVVGQRHTSQRRDRQHVAQTHANLFDAEVES